MTVALQPRTRALATAAIRADARASASVDLGDAWQDLIHGRLRLHAIDRTPSRQYVLARAVVGPIRPGTFLTPIETTILSRVLCGESQAALSRELRIASSTASKWCSSALEKLNLNRRFVPLPIVAAAQSWVLGPTPAIDRRSARFDYDGASFLVLSVRRPTIGLDAPLTASEREVAIHLVEGDTRQDIAARRSTSMQTVGRQLGAIFSKLEARGRFSLIRRAAVLGWLH